MENTSGLKETEIEEAILRYREIMPLLSKEVNTLSRKELKRILLAVLKYPIEMDKIRLLSEKEDKLFRLALSVVSDNMAVWSYAAHQKMQENENNVKQEQNEETGSSVEG